MYRYSVIYYSIDFDFEHLDAGNLSQVNMDEPKNIRYRNFKLENEDHTMGTLLTYILDRMPETELCGYTNRHPTENVIYIRLKVKEGCNVNTVFEKGVTELKNALEVIESKFVVAVDTFNREQME